MLICIARFVIQKLLSTYYVLDIVFLGHVVQSLSYVQLCDPMDRICLFLDISVNKVDMGLCPC